MFMHPHQSFAEARPVTGTNPGRSTGLAAGLVAGTRVETEAGWTNVAAIRAGTRLYTHDGGLQAVAAVERRRLSPGIDGVLVRVPGGSFGACADLLLMPGQQVMVETPRRAPRPEHAWALVPALALDGVAGARAEALAGPVEVITPVFACEEVIWANSGVRLYCPGAGAAAGVPPRDSYFTVIGGDTAAALLRRASGRRLDAAA
jgi:hypothetical protein